MGESPSDCDALLLPAGELIRVMVRPLPKADGLQCGHCTGMALRCFHRLVGVEQGQLDIIEG